MKPFLIKYKCEMVCYFAAIIRERDEITIITFGLLGKLGHVDVIFAFL